MRAENETINRKDPIDLRGASVAIEELHSPSPFKVRVISADSRAPVVLQCTTDRDRVPPPDCHRLFFSWFHDFSCVMHSFGFADRDPQETLFYYEQIRARYCIYRISTILKHNKTKTFLLLFLITRLVGALCAQL